MQSKQILIHQLSFIFSNDKPLFNALTCAFAQRKIGLVGRNGIGKSTLIKLIMGQMRPTAGAIQVHGSIAYVPQNPDTVFGLTTVAELLGYAAKLDALQRIENGSVYEQDYAILNEEWDIAIRLQQQLAMFGLSAIAPERRISDLSGGELTRVLLSQAFSSDADFLLLDEPTNHLDSAARQQLYQAIEEWQRGIIIISHDRKLLNHMEEIIELSTLGVHYYGGNYDDYAEQKKLETAAAQQLLQTRKALQHKAKQATQLRRERHEQNEAKGNKAKKAQIQAKGSYDKLEFKSKQGRSEQTNRRIRVQADRKLEYVESQCTAAREKIEMTDAIDVSLPATQVPNGKIILDIEALTFSYPNNPCVIFDNFNLKLQGPERIALTGANGSGKTTLIKLILGQLAPQKGSVYVGTQYVSYLDQNASQLNPAISVLENFQHFNPESSLQAAHQALAQFLFRNTTALKLVKDLSGGERLRALLACVLMAPNPPQLLILDEPTNHLDLHSIESIESALAQYQGAMVVVSHDERFLTNIGATKAVRLPSFPVMQ